MFKIIYTNHSLQRLNERRISKKEIEKAIGEGEKENAVGDLRKSTQRNENTALVVIYNIKSAEEVVIITAYRV